MISTTELYVLIGKWEHESHVAEASLRVDEYPKMCRDTLELLRELAERRGRDDPNTRTFTQAEIQQLMGRSDG